MSLRKSPIRTPTLLAACWANAQKFHRSPDFPGQGPVAPELAAARTLMPQASPLSARGAQPPERVAYQWIQRMIGTCFRPGPPGNGTGRYAWRSRSGTKWRGRWEEVQAGILLKTGEFEKNILRPITKPVSDYRPSFEAVLTLGIRQPNSKTLSWHDATTSQVSSVVQLMTSRLIWE